MRFHNLVRLSLLALAIVFTPVSGWSAVDTSASGSVNLTLTGVRSDRGLIVVSLCTRSTFLGDCAFVERVPARRGTVSVTFANVVPGTYAIMAFHDETNTGVLHKGAYGIPLDGIAVSNDASSDTGPPKFDDAAFDVRGETRIHAQLQY